MQTMTIEHNLMRSLVSAEFPTTVVHHFAQAFQQLGCSSLLIGRFNIWNKTTAVLTTVLFFSIVAVVVVVVDSFNGFTWRGGVVSNPRIIRSTRSAADRLASSVRVALSCFSPYGLRGEFEGSDAVRCSK